MMDGAVGILLLLIVGVTALLARTALRGDRLRDTRRGSPPGKGHHQMHASYSSGLGGHQASWTVPKDPQAYAKTFVPKDRKP